MQEIIKYMEENFGIQAGIWPLKSSEKANLLLYLKGNYNLYHGTLGGLQLIWAKVENDEILTPDQLQKQTWQLRQILHAPVVFVFNKMESWHHHMVLVMMALSYILSEKVLYKVEYPLLSAYDIREVMLNLYSAKGFTEEELLQQIRKRHKQRMIMPKKDTS